MATSLIVLFAILSIVYLFFLLTSNERNEKRRLWIGFGIVMVAGIFFHMYHFLGEANWWTAFVWSTINSAEMFIGDSHIETILISRNINWDPIPKWYVPFYFAVYSCALLTSAYFILKLVFSRVLKNFKIWLKVWKYNLFDKHLHYNVFFEKNNPTNVLTNNLLSSANEEVIVISSPGDMSAKRFSILDLFMMDGSKGNSFDSSKSKRYATLLSKKPFKLIQSDSLPSILMEIKCWCLKKIIYNADLYFLSDNEENNILLALKFASLDLSGKIYCHCRQEFITKYYAEAYYAYNIIFVDSAKLAVASLKKHESEKEEETFKFHPINYVDVARDASGRKLGYVMSPFYSLILGFGQTGQEALSFLYEYGAFVGKNKERSKFHCVVYDREMERLKGSFVNFRPGMDKDLVTFRSVDVGSEEFWQRLNAENTELFNKSFVSQVNYIVVTLGDNRTNLQVSLELLEHIYKVKQKDLSKLIVLVHLTNMDKREKDTLSFYQKRYSFNGKEIIYPFGSNEDIWKMDLISNKPAVQAASVFYESYQNASCETELVILDTSAFVEEISIISEELFKKFRKNDISEYKDFIRGILSHQECSELQQNVVDEALKLKGDPIRLAYFFVITQKKFIKGFMSRRLRKAILKSLLVYVDYDIYKVSIASGHDADVKNYHVFINTLSSEVNKINRQEAQDFSNAVHVFTKKQLVDSSVIDESSNIETSYGSWKARIEASGQTVKKGAEMSHYSGGDEFAGKSFEYLAIGEHLRWEASHIMLGYYWVKNAETDDLLKVHDCMIPYDELIKLDDEMKGVYQHYDWSVVKTSLSM